MCDWYNYLSLELQMKTYLDLYHSASFERLYAVIDKEVYILACPLLVVLEDCFTSDISFWVWQKTGWDSINDKQLEAEYIGSI